MGRLTEISKLASHMKRPDVKMIKGHVTGIDAKEWVNHRFSNSHGTTTGRSNIVKAVSSFSLMTEENELLVVFPKKADVNLDVGTEVWVVGKEIGPTRIEAVVVYLPRLQRVIDLTENNISIRKLFGFWIAALMIWLVNIGQSFIWALMIIPTLLVILFIIERRPVRSSDNRSDIIRLEVSFLI